MNINRNLLRLEAGSRLALILTIVLGFVAAVLTVLQAGLLSRSIGQVFLAGRSLSQVAGLLTLFLVVIVARALLAWGSEISANTLAVQVKTGLRQRLFARHQQVCLLNQIVRSPEILP